MSLQFYSSLNSPSSCDCLCIVYSGLFPEPFHGMVTGMEPLNVQFYSGES